MTIYKLIAQEDISYRVANSYPKDGFFVAAGDSIRINSTGLKMLTVRKWGSKQRGKYQLEEVK